MAPEQPRTGPAAPPPPAGPRLRFVDALRGLAVALMVVNHTARWWLEPAVGAQRESLIYVSMVLAGPTFLLLVGMSLALAYHAALARGRPFRAVALRQLRRAAGILAAGFLVNALVFPADLLGARVLVSIALAIVLATPLLPLVRHRVARWALLGLAPALYVAFLGALPDLARWSRAHPVAAALFLREFPVLPWLGLVLAGLVLGSAEARGREAARRERRYAALGAAGVLGIAAYLALGAGAPLASRLAIGRDLSLNDYWTAAPVTAVGMVGAILVLLAGTRTLVERGGWRLPALVALGRAALPIYVVHLVIVAPVARDAWGLALRSWASYALATALLLSALVGLATVWLAVRARTSGAPGPPSPSRGGPADAAPADAPRPHAAIASRSPS
jgi:uncharacterized membrane protein